MNPNIQKFADQARFVDTQTYPHQDQIFEYFAQLIVQDVIRLVALYGIHNYDNPDVSRVCQHIVNEITQRFGVEP
jgi:hypothetical protein